MPEIITYENVLEEFKEEMRDLYKDITQERKEDLERALALAARYTTLALTSGNPERHLFNAKMATGLALDVVAMAEADSQKRIQQAIINVTGKLIGLVLAAV